MCWRTWKPFSSLRAPGARPRPSLRKCIWARRSPCSAGLDGFGAGGPFPPETAGAQFPRTARRRMMMKQRRAMPPPAGSPCRPEVAAQVGPEPLAAHVDHQWRRWFVYGASRQRLRPRSRRWALRFCSSTPPRYNSRRKARWRSPRQHGRRHGLSGFHAQGRQHWRRRRSPP